MGKINFMHMNLQLLAEGGDSGNVSGENAAVTGQESVENAAVTEQEKVRDLEAEFAEMIKGEYKDVYGKRVQDIIQKRLKSSKEIVDKYNALDPMLRIIGRKYGIDHTDVSSIVDAVKGDDFFIEERAMRNGLSVEAQRKIDGNDDLIASLQDRVSHYEQQERERFADEQSQRWVDEAEKLQKIYPGFDLSKEMDNHEFKALLRNNVSVRAAYEVLHRDEIIPVYMHQAATDAAKETEEKISAAVAANRSRPRENGVGGANAASLGIDVSKLTKAQRDEYVRRAMNGDTIDFKTHF